MANPNPRIRKRKIPSVESNTNDGDNIIKIYSFEDKIDIINNEIAKRRARWQLKARPEIDYMDISQIILLHVFLKWSKWDQSFPLEPWLNRLITNQTINLLRNNYSNFVRPCTGCSCNQGGDLCSIYGTQNNSCPLFAKWEKNKKNAYDTKMPLPLDNHINEIFSMPDTSTNIEDQVIDLHKRMKVVLTPSQYRIYTYLYIDGLEDNEVARIMNYKTKEKDKNPGYKILCNVKKIIVAKAKKIIAEDM